MREFSACKRFCLHGGEIPARFCGKGENFAALTAEADSMIIPRDFAGMATGLLCRG